MDKDSHPRITNNRKYDGKVQSSTNSTSNIVTALYNCVADRRAPHLGLELVAEMRVVELDKAEEERTFVGDAVVLGDLILHVLLQEGHVAEEAAGEGPQQLEEQLDLGVVTPGTGRNESVSVLNIDKR